MSKYKELKTISKKYKGKEVYAIAAELGIKLGTEEDCKKTFTISPLNTNNAVLTTAGNRYMVYYKQDQYQSYYILHELCHYINKHNADGKYEENQADMLACMILIPDKEVYEDMLSLSYRYNIPPDIIYKYLPLIRQSISLPIKRSLIALLTVVFIAVFMFPIFFNKLNTNSQLDIPQTTELTTPKTTETIKTSDNAVYVTKYGKCYHKQNCHYIQGKEVTSLQFQEANKVGYTPCSVCY